MTTGRVEYWRFSSVQDLQAVHAGQGDVQQHQVGKVFPHHFERGLPVRGGENLKAFVLQDAGYGLENLRLVVNYQQRCRHNWPYAWGFR